MSEEHTPLKTRLLACPHCGAEMEQDEYYFWHPRNGEVCLLDKDAYTLSTADLWNARASDARIEALEALIAEAANCPEGFMPLGLLPVPYKELLDRIEALEAHLSFWANRKTIAEIMAGQDPDEEWRDATAERRIELMGERKRKHDEEVLAARTLLEKRD